MGTTPQLACFCPVTFNGPMLNGREATTLLSSRAWACAQLHIAPAVLRALISGNARGAVTAVAVVVVAEGVALLAARCEPVGVGACEHGEHRVAALVFRRRQALHATPRQQQAVKKKKKKPNNLGLKKKKQAV